MTKTPTVLLAEDSPDDRFLIERALRRSRQQVSLQVVADGEEAIAYLGGEGAFADRQRHPMPQLLLLDWKLSRRSGLEVLRWIRARPYLDALPVVVLTASGEDGDLHAAFAARANSFLQKPGASGDLLDLIDCTLAYWLRHNLAPAAPCIPVP
ncbi:response regulator [Lysobacter korlensis]|uniref:Response regulator n=1 Tax=Lysobacter korlensis TaxID=553636 RepID=A0ABV6RLS4_9GAMM